MGWSADAFGRLGSQLEQHVCRCTKPRGRLLVLRRVSFCARGPLWRLRTFRKWESAIFYLPPSHCLHRAPRPSRIAASALLSRSRRVDKALLAFARRGACQEALASTLGASMRSPRGVSSGPSQSGVPQSGPISGGPLRIPPRNWRPELGVGRKVVPLAPLLMRKPVRGPPGRPNRLPHEHSACGTDANLNGPGEPDMRHPLHHSRVIAGGATHERARATTHHLGLQPTATTGTTPDHHDTRAETEQAHEHTRRREQAIRRHRRRQQRRRRSVLGNERTDDHRT